MIEMMKEQQMQTILDMQKKKDEEGDDKGRKVKNEKDEDIKKKINPKTFLGIDKLESKEQWDQWAWAMKYRIKVESKEFGKLIDKVETMTEKEMMDAEIDMVGSEDEARSAELYCILSDRVSGEAMTQIRSTKAGDGLMAWKRLYANFNPTTLSGTLMKIIEAVRPNKVKDVKKVNGEILEWEKKYREAGDDVKDISDRGRTAILASMLPDEIYEVVIQNVEKGEYTYQATKEKVISMVTSRIARDEYKTMEIGLAGEKDVDFDIDAVNMNTKCYQCGGFGHISRNCPKGKGVGKGIKGGKGFEGKGGGVHGGPGNFQGAGTKGGGKGGLGGKGLITKGTGNGYQGTCYRCFKVGHKAAECYANVNEVDIQGEGEEENSEVRECAGVWFVGEVEKIVEVEWQEKEPMKRSPKCQGGRKRIAGGWKMSLKSKTHSKIWRRKRMMMKKRKKKSALGINPALGTL